MKSGMNVSLPDFSKLNVVVVGDIMIDEYIWGNVERISPEAPVPVVKVIDKTYGLGGAANVAANLAGLGCQINMIGVLGKDAFGKQLDLLFREKSINNKSLIIDSFPTICKTRIMGMKQQLLRIDYESRNKIQDGTFDKLIQIFTENASQADVVVLSDYDKGIFRSPFIRTCIEHCRTNKIPVFVDPKTNDWSRYSGATCITPNEKEFNDVCQTLLLSDKPLDESGSFIRKAFDFGSLVVTRGAKGMMLFQKEQTPVVIPTQAREVFDVSGAGDTVIAVLTAAFAAGCPMPYSMHLANIAAGVVVGKVSTHPISLDELHDALKISVESHLHKIYSVEEGLLKIKKWRDRGETIVFTNGCFDLIHPGHIKLLKIAANEGGRLIVGLNTDESVRKLKGPLRPVLNEKDRASILEALECVDMIVLFDEETPINLIQRFKPDVIVKGQDYSKENVVGASFVESWGGKVVLIPLEKGKSTSLIIENITNGIDVFGENEPI